MEINEQERLMVQKKIYSLLGLSGKAGSLASGEFSTEKSVKEGRAKLVIIAGDASENTKKMFCSMCDYYNVPYFIFSDKETLGHKIGKEIRTSVAVKDEGMAKEIKKQFIVLSGLEREVK